MIDVEGLPRPAEGRYRGDLPLLWIEGRSLMDGEPLWLPYELVHTNYTLPQPTGSGCFPANTNGLASGNHHLEAVAHGIYEVIERDAITLWWLQSEARPKRSVRLDSIGDPTCRTLLQQFERAGLDVHVWNVTSDLGVPVFLCLVIGKDDDDTEPEFGSGCHPARQVALLRALTEAAQARTTYISGSRDDFSADIYGAPARASRARACRALMAEDAAEESFDEIPSLEAETIVRDIAWTLDRLRRVGIDQVAVVDLTQERFQIPVVRVVIPGLEGVYKGGHPDFSPGPRARAGMTRAP